MKYAYAQTASLTHVGMKRVKNQDAFVSIPDRGVFCVADGMGGGDAGEVASGRVVEAIERFSKDLDEAEGVDNLKFKCKYLSRVLTDTGHEIKQFADEHGYSSCGTTAVILVLDDNQPTNAAVLHVGDSRLYRLREGLMQQLTVDHSAENESSLGKKGVIHPSMKNVITRAIGVHMNLQVEVTDVQVQPGDLYLVCSDGLSGMVTDEGIQDILVARSDLDRCAQALVDAANAGGGKDNTTVTLIEVGEDSRFHEPAPELEAFDSDEAEEETTGENHVFPPKVKAGRRSTTADAIEFPETGATAPTLGITGPVAAGAVPDEDELEAALKKMHRQRNSRFAAIRKNPLGYILIPLLLVVTAVLLYFYAEKQFGDRLKKPKPVENPWNLEKTTGLDAFVAPIEDPPEKPAFPKPKED